MRGYGRAEPWEWRVWLFLAGREYIDRRIHGERRAAAQRAGVREPTSDILRRARPGSTATRYSFTGTPSRRQDSITDKIAATFGPDCALPTCSQFLRPKATGAHRVLH